MRRRKSPLIRITLLLLMLAMSGFVGGSAHAGTSRLELKPILSGYQLPVAVTNAGSAGRSLFVVEQGGKIRIIRFAGGAYRKGGTLLDISDRVNDPTLPGNRERGLLSLAFHPNYKQNRLFYVFYTRNANGDHYGDAVVAEFRRNPSGSRRPSQANPASERIVMVIQDGGGYHYSGHLAFGPDDRLYIGLGDNGGQNDPLQNGQDLSTLWGSILRIDPGDPDGDGARGYSVPQNNPFVGQPGRAQIWAYGLRNPWRFSFDRESGNLWIGDVGQRNREEVNKARSNRLGRGAGRGANYGWSECEGSIEHSEDGDSNNDCDDHARPVYEYDHGRTQCAVTGGYVYRGPTSKAWRGLYVAGDFCGQMFAIDRRGDEKWSADSGVNVTSFGEDTAGRLFAVSVVSGKIYQVLMRGPRPA